VRGAGGQGEGLSLATTVVPAYASCTGRLKTHDAGSAASRASDCIGVKRDPSTATTRCLITIPPSVCPEMLQQATW
jgi:hypothetical protein